MYINTLSVSCLSVIKQLSPSLGRWQRVEMSVQVMVVLTVTRCVLGQRDLPSPPKIVYGGFVPIIMDNQFSENIHIQHKLTRDRTSKSLPFYTDKLSYSESKYNLKLFSLSLIYSSPARLQVLPARGWSGWRRPAVRPAPASRQQQAQVPPL